MRKQYTEYYCDLCGNRIEKDLITKLMLPKDSSVSYHEVCENCVDRISELMKRIEIESRDLPFTISEITI